MATRHDLGEKGLLILRLINLKFSQLIIKEILQGLEKVIRSFLDCLLEVITMVNVKMFEFKELEKKKDIR
jgi:hypothetical protein